MSEIEKIEKMLSNGEKTELNRMKMNIVRVLAVYKGVSWKTELFEDLTKLLEFLGQSNIVKSRILDEALTSLTLDGIVTVEERTRGTMLEEGSYKDQLIRLNDLANVKSALQKDSAFTRYMQSRDKMIREALFK